jgi:hypothetical protein
MSDSSMYIFHFNVLTNDKYMKLCIGMDENDRLCGLVVKVPGYRFRGPGLIPSSTRFFLRSSGSGTGSTPPRDDNLGSI